MIDKCCAVVVSYNPTQQIIENVKALIPQVAEILIVDNGSDAGSLRILEELSKESAVTVEHNRSNLGIATALNQGVKYASERGYEWLATFDQDSLAPVNYLQTMFDAYSSCEDHKLVAIIAPRYQTNTGIISFSKEEDRGQNFSKIKTTMTSGNLVKIDTFRKVGLFEDSFFIDYVDHEFCLRVRSKGLLIIESPKSLLFHELGSSATHRFMNTDIITTGHSATRRYYKYRNMIITCKKYYWFDPLLVIKYFKSLIFEPLKIIFLEDEKLLKLKYIYTGIIDGIKSIQGEIIR